MVGGVNRALRAALLSKPGEGVKVNKRQKSYLVVPPPSAQTTIFSTTTSNNNSSSSSSSMTVTGQSSTPDIITSPISPSTSTISLSNSNGKESPISNHQVLTQGDSHCHGQDSPSTPPPTHLGMMSPQLVLNQNYFLREWKKYWEGGEYVSVRWEGENGMNWK